VSGSIQKPVRAENNSWRVTCNLVQKINSGIIFKIAELQRIVILSPLR
jgi:hypothetical protein